MVRQQRENAINVGIEQRTQLGSFESWTKHVISREKFALLESTVGIHVADFCKAAYYALEEG